MNSQGQPTTKSSGTRAHEEIAVRAYRLWRERGSPIGSPEVDWFRAEQTHAAQEATRIGVLLVPDRRWRADAIKFLVLRLNTLQGAFCYEFLPTPTPAEDPTVSVEDPLIRRLRRRWGWESGRDAHPDCSITRANKDHVGRWGRICRECVRAEFEGFLHRYAEYAAGKSDRLDLRDRTLPENFIIVSLARFGSKHYGVSEQHIAVLGLGDWKKSMAPPSIVEAILTLLIRLSVGISKGPELLASRHLGTKGCLFDFNQKLSEVKFKVLQGFICQQCREALALDGNGGIVDELAPVLSRDWIGRTSTPGSPANIVANLGHDLFVTKGFKPGFWQSFLATLQKDGTKELIKLAFLVIGTALLAWLGLKCVGGG